MKLVGGVYFCTHLTLFVKFWIITASYSYVHLLHIKIWLAADFIVADAQTHRETDKTITVTLWHVHQGLINEAIPMTCYLNFCVCVSAVTL